MQGKLCFNEKLVVLVGLMKHRNFQAHVEAIILVHSLPTRGQAVTEAEMQSAVIHGAIKRFVNDQFLEVAFGPHVRKLDKVEIEELCVVIFGERCTEALKTAVLMAWAHSGRTIQRTRPQDIKINKRTKTANKRRYKNAKEIGSLLRENGAPMDVEMDVEITPQSRLPVIPDCAPMHVRVTPQSPVPGIPDGAPMHVRVTPQSPLPVIPETTEPTDVSLSFEDQFAVILVATSETLSDQTVSTAR